MPALATNVVAAESKIRRGELPLGRRREKAMDASRPFPRAGIGRFAATRRAPCPRGAIQ
jgi:hypothetical protein